METTHKEKSKEGSKQSNNSSSPSMPTWHSLLAEAFRTPGMVHKAYRAFRGYSLRNQLLALVQCDARGITLGPLGTFMHWQALGRKVRLGERALTLCVPVSRRTPRTDEVTEESDIAVRFSYQRRWFTLCQTEGPEVLLPVLPSWNAYTALERLGVRLVPFEEVDGNIQGYALPQRRISISPVAALPHKTLLHELAHIVLCHHESTLSPGMEEIEAELVTYLLLDALGLTGMEYSRGYLQTWATSTTLAEETATRVLRAANTILEAGVGPSVPGG